MEKKIELECDYCHSPLTVDHYKCSNCGADCTVKVKKYKEQMEKEEEIKRQQRIERSKAYQRKMKLPVYFIFGVAGFILVFTVIMFISSFRRSGDSSKISEIVKEESVVCTYDSYELYAFTSDTFPEEYETPDGYQKIAFHITCENKSSSDQSISAFNMHLTADDYSVEMADLEPGMFEKISQGTGDYPYLLNHRMAKGEKLQGYVGYLVPKNRKKLKLTIYGKTTEIDNPVYEKE